MSNVACGFDVLGFALHRTGRRGDGAYHSGGRADRRHLGRRRPHSARAGAEHGRRGGAGAAGAARSSRRRRADASRRDCRCRAVLAAVRPARRRRWSRSMRCSAPMSPIETLVACALEGERLGAGSAHADNIAPCDLRRLRAGPPCQPTRCRPAAGAPRVDGGRGAS